MRAISVKQPYASLIISGDKNIENRTRVLNDNGPIAICSTKIPNAEGLKEFPGDYPNGVLVGVVDIVGFVWIEVIEGRENKLNLEKDDLTLMFDPESLGNIDLDWFEPDCIGWVLSNPRPCKQVPVKGQLGIYHIPDEIIEYL